MDQVKLRSKDLADSPPDKKTNEGTADGTCEWQQAIATLYDEHAPTVFHYLLVILGNRAEAEDALQSIFVELVRRHGSLQEIHSPRTYLLTMARHWVQRSRQLAAHRRLAESKAVEERFLRANNPDLHDADETAQLEAAIMGLCEEQREVLVLKAFEELTFREIATILNIPENTAASRYRYALDKLRARWTGGSVPGERK